MTTLLITWAVCLILLGLFWRKTGRGLAERKELIDKSFEMGTHNWTVKEGIQPNTQLYEFENGMSAMHNKTLNRLYIYKEDGFPAEKPIDTTSITVQEFEETLLGIEKR